MRAAIGVDGCHGGYVAAIDDGRGGRIAVFARFAEILALDAAAVIAVDMPIGLPEAIGPGGRAPEKLVRPLLGARQSSVFAVPARAAVEASDYRAACALARAASDPPRQVSKQCFHLFPKIREIDAVLRADPALVGRVHESHPEVAFMRLNGEAPLSEPKKVKSRPYPPGLALRRALLARAGIAAALLDARPRGAGPDDVLDALACLTVARRIIAGTARSFPDPPGRDAHGLPIAIWA